MGWRMGRSLIKIIFSPIFANTEICLWFCRRCWGLLGLGRRMIVAFFHSFGKYKTSRILLTIMVKI